MAAFLRRNRLQPPQLLTVPWWPCARKASQESTHEPDLWLGDHADWTYQLQPCARLADPQARILPSVDLQRGERSPLRGQQTQVRWSLLQRHRPRRAILRDSDRRIGAAAITRRRD
jgi:hypothetical protein